jgi:hypothetical protein
MIDETRIGGGDQRLYFYNVTNVIQCIDFDRSETEGKKVIKPVFVPGSVPIEDEVFKDSPHRRFARPAPTSRLRAGPGNAPTDSPALQEGDRPPPGRLTAQQCRHGEADAPSER